MMPVYLNTRRFQLVFFGDAFFYPFDNRGPSGQHAGHGCLRSAAGKNAFALEKAGGD